MSEPNPAGETGRLLAEIREQPQVLGRVLASCGRDARERGAAARGKTLHLVGCGDMAFAAGLVTALAEQAGGAGAVRPWRSMDLRWLHRRLGADDVVVCASVSGRTPRTVEAARLARAAGARVIGVTDDPGSPLAETVSDCLVLGTAPPELLARHAYAGYRSVLPQTQTFTAVLAVELTIAATHARAPALLPEALAERVATQIAALDPAIARLAPRFLAGGERIAVLGSGPHREVAGYGAAKMIEYAVPASAQCLEEWCHLQAFLADERTRVVLLAADAPSAHRAAELTGPIEELGARSLLIARPEAATGAGGAHTTRLTLPASSEDDPIDAIWAEIVALQLLAAHGAAPLGRDPERWLGGRRTELVLGVSQRTIRGSAGWEPRARATTTRKPSPTDR